MKYTIEMPEFEGPLDLLLHLIKQSDIDIFSLKIETITNQYMDYINKMESLNLDIASEYLVMAAELLEIKSHVLLPKQKIENQDNYEEDPKERLIQKLLEYKQYKEITKTMKELEKNRKDIFTKIPSDLKEYQTKSEVKTDLSLNDLITAFNNFLKRKELEKPLNTKITKKEYSVNERSSEIKNILKKKRKVNFEELFDILSKEYIIVTFLSILDLAKKGEIEIKQSDNFNQIVIEGKGA